MSLSKQLYGIILFVFLLMFVGNTYITITNTKEYLEIESVTKAQDTATSLGMILKSMINNKKDPEIALTINAISDSGFYEYIRLEDMYYSFTDKELLQANGKIDDLTWQITNINIDKKYGKIIINEDDTLMEELNQLENENDTMNIKDNTYTFMPSTFFKDGNKLEIKYSISKNNIQIDNMSSTLKLSKVLVNSVRPVKFYSVPQWFINLVEIDLDEKRSQINDGWKTTAEISVKANSGVAYLKLYEQVKEAIIYSIVSFVFAILLMVIIVRLILRPLSQIEILANNISNGNFEQIKNLPWTRELKNVSIAMNSMTSKIENIINKLNKNISDVSKQLSNDQLTKLPLKQVFENDLKNMFIEKENGYVFIIHISNLSDFVKNNGRNTVDKFLIDFSNILSNINGLKAYRFYGSEFALILKECKEEQLRIITLNIIKEFDKLGKKYNKQNVANAGSVLFGQFDTFGTVLSGASEAYEMAKQIGPNAIFSKEKNENTRGTLAWKELVDYIIDNKKIDLKYIGDIKCVKNESTLLIQEAFGQMKDENNENIPIGIFLSIAEENDKVIEFDEIVVSKVIDYIRQNNIKHQISINLSIESIKNIQFLSWLKKIIQENYDISQQLIFSLTAYNIARYMDIFHEFSCLIKEQNSHIMIKRFELKFIDIDEIKNIKPYCIRLAKEYTCDISIDDNKRVLVDSICKISNLLDIQLYAESVVSENDFILVKSLELNGVSR